MDWMVLLMAGAAAATVGYLLFGFESKDKKAMKRRPVVRIADATKVGEVLVIGTVELDPEHLLKTPLSERECGAYRFTVKSHTRGSSTPNSSQTRVEVDQLVGGVFLLNDGSGTKARIDARTIRFVGSQLARPDDARIRLFDREGYVIDNELPGTAIR